MGVMSTGSYRERVYSAKRVGTVGGYSAKLFRPYSATVADSASEGRVRKPWSEAISANSANHSANSASELSASATTSPVLRTGNVALWIPGTHLGKPRNDAS